MRKRGRSRILHFLTRDQRIPHSVRFWLSISAMPGKRPLAFCFQPFVESAKTRADTVFLGEYDVIFEGMLSSFSMTSLPASGSGRIKVWRPIITPGPFFFR